MAKSWRRGAGRTYQDDYEIYSKNEIEYREHKKEKRTQAALKSKNINALVDDDEDYEEEKDMGGFLEGWDD